MMKLSMEQLNSISQTENEDFVDSVIKELESTEPSIVKDKLTLKERLVKALGYAKSVNIKRSGLLRSFLYLEASQPGFADNPVIRSALEESHDPEQRYKDIIHSAVNLARRG